MLTGCAEAPVGEADGMRAYALYRMNDYDVLLIAAISVKVLPVGCVTSAGANVDAACILEGPMPCFVVPVAGPHWK